MNLVLRLSPVVVAGLLLGGCATGPGAKGRVSAPPGREAQPHLSRSAQERRVQAYAHFAAGSVYEAQEEPEKALREFWEAALADPSNEALAIDVAQHLLPRQQADKAVTVLSRAASQPGASGLVYGWLGLAQAQLGNSKEAMAADRTAIKLAPSLVMGYQNLAQQYLHLRQPREALKVLDEAARQSKVTPAFLVDVADVLAGAGRTKVLDAGEVKPRVLALLERAAKLGAEQPLILQRMADLYKVVGELSKATELYQDLLKNYPPANPAFTPLLREQLFQLYLRSGDKTKAAEQLQAILRENPTNPQAYYLLGTLASEEKHFTEAAGYLEKALLFKSDLEPAYYDLAGVQITLNQPEVALETLGKARRMFPASFILEFYTGVAQAGTKRWGDAVRSYTAAEVLAKAADQSSSLTPVFYFQFGSAYERNGDFAAAEEQFRKCLKLAPDYSEALNYLGYMWAERGTNLKEALTMVQKAVKAEPKNAAFLDSLGWVLFKLDRAGEALPYLEQAIANSETGDATLYDHLGDIQAALGQVENARNAWRKSLELEPNVQIRKKLGGPPGASEKR